MFRHPLKHFKLNYTATACEQHHSCDPDVKLLRLLKYLPGAYWRQKLYLVRIETNVDSHSPNEEEGADLRSSENDHSVEL